MWRSRLGALFMVLVAVILVRFGQEGYRWYAFGEERAQIRAMTERLEEVGYRVVRTQLQADSLRSSIEAADSLLENARRRMDAYERRASLGILPHAQFESYRRELETFNRDVTERNHRLAHWETVIGENHAVVEHYNQLADSIRAVAASMGEPYFDVPAPVEMAARRGLTPPP
jgi:predicted  nucleic acid-binding Zn-ribbon protein